MIYHIFTFLLAQYKSLPQFVSHQSTLHSQIHNFSHLFPHIAKGAKNPPKLFSLLTCKSTSFRTLFSTQQKVRRFHIHLLCLSSSNPYLFAPFPPRDKRCEKLIDLCRSSARPHLGSQCLPLSHARSYSWLCRRPVRPAASDWPAPAGQSNE